MNIIIALFATTEIAVSIIFFYFVLGYCMLGDPSNRSNILTIIFRNAIYGILNLMFYFVIGGILLQLLFVFPISLIVAYIFSKLPFTERTLRRISSAFHFVNLLAVVGIVYHIYL